MGLSQTAFKKFLSTLPARGATSSAPWTPCGPRNFYPRSPRGERPGARPSIVRRCGISIHAPREGSDGASGPATAEDLEFLSTLPARGATTGG